MERSNRRHRRPTRVLLVDDYPAIRRIVRITCEHHGVEVVAEAGLGQDAIEAASRTHPDVVVLDLDLPDIHGLEVARRMRQQDRPPRILILSGSAKQSSIAESIEAGAAGYLDKNVDEDTVVWAIEQVTRSDDFVRRPEA